MMAAILYRFALVVFALQGKTNFFKKKKAESHNNESTNPDPLPRRLRRSKPLDANRALTTHIEYSVPSSPPSNVIIYPIANPPSIIAPSITPNSSSKHVHLSPGSGGTMTCARLEAKHEYYMEQVKELKEQNVTVPAYLAGYASAAGDSLRTLGCPVKSGSTGSGGNSSE